MADLNTFSNAPRTITKRLQMTGPAGANNAPANVTVTTGAGGGTQETIDLVTLVAGNQVGSAAYNEIGDQGRITVSAGAGCYWLPWHNGRVYKMQLAAAQSTMFTYTLNGCGFFVAGPRNSPTVMHANADCQRLIAAVDPNDGAATMVAQTAIYDSFYAGMAAQMMTANQFPSQDPVMFLPSTYLGANSGFGAVFGVCNGGSWTFYYNCRGQTRELWPNFDR